MGITKNHQSGETLRLMAAAAFPDKQLDKVKELTEGMFNAAYLMEFADGTSAVAKIAAGTSEGFLSNEINLMAAEVAAMELLGTEGVPKVPRVYYSDFTRSLCNGPYFIMERMPGRSLFAMREEVPREIQKQVYFEAGQLQRRLTKVQGESFGLLGDQRRFASLYEMLRFMFVNLLGDAARIGLSFGFSEDALFRRLERDQACFDQVTVPSLVHWDMWEGNLFVDDGHLSGVIDWERAMWSDPFMDDRFRTRNHNSAFLEGFGIEEFTPEEKRRILWYDLFLHVTMYTESHYRQYDNIEDEIRWLTPQVEGAWAQLEKAVAVH